MVLAVGAENCSNSIITAASIPGTQQHKPVELHEIEQEELLHDELLRMEYGEEVVVEGESDEEDYNSEGKDDERKTKKSLKNRFNT